MRIRTYGLVVLAVAGVAPLIAFGALAVQRSQRTAIAEVREGNARLAHSLARRLDDYTAHERELIRNAGAAALQAPTPEAAEALLDAFSLSYLHVHDLAVYRQDGARFAGSPRHAELSAPAIAGTPSRGKLVPAGADTQGPFAHSAPFAEPVMIAGRQEGAVIGRIDLIGLWEPVNSVRVGDTGFVRLLSTDGELLAHGDPEERRHVFEPDHQVDARLLAHSFTGLTATNQQGDEVVVSAALVPTLDAVVIVEQNVDEAFASARALRTDLILWIAGALICVVITGIVLGRLVVSSLERLRGHTAVLARGELQAKAEPRTSVTEIVALANSLDEMAASLQLLQDKARQEERLATFSRVAAGLAHDLRQPVEMVRMAAEMVLESPDDPSCHRLLAEVSRRDLPKLVRYVDDLRRLAQSGQLELEVQRVSPRELAEQVAQDLSTSPKYAGVNFEVVGEAPELTADPRLVQRAVANLAQNGADACLETGGGRTVTIEVADSALCVEFRVMDQGAGIAPERLASLLNNDFHSTKRSHGVGLGLGVVRQVAESHRGRLELSSQVGAGSTFSLVLPKQGPSHAQTTLRD